MSLAEAINLIRTSNDAVESSLLIGMAVAPTLLGFVLSLPAFMVIAAGRAAITWRASVTKETSVVPKPHLKPASSNSMESLYEESERYLAKLTRSRES